MSLAILGAAGRGVVLDHPECVRISYPAFYQTLEKFRA
jgi:3-phosphoshikimate 1-carboxyvinyltransferase